MVHWLRKPVNILDDLKNFCRFFSEIGQTNLKEQSDARENLASNVLLHRRIGELLQWLEYLHFSQYGDLYMQSDLEIQIMLILHFHKFIFFTYF